MQATLILPHLVTFVFVLIVLSFFSIQDIRDGRIPNRHTYIAIVCGFTVIVLSRPVQEVILLHLISGAFALSVGCYLYRVGAIGGADVKTLLFVALISPGLEFESWTNPILEALIGVGIEVSVMLLLGILMINFQRLSHLRNKLDETKLIKKRSSVPLVPFLFIGYLLLQSLVLIL